MVLTQCRLCLLLGSMLTTAGTIDSDANLRDRRQRALEGRGGGAGVTRCRSFDPARRRSSSIDTDACDCRSEVSA